MADFDARSTNTRTLLNVADQEASHPRKRATQEYSYHFLFHSKLHQNQKASAYYTMPNQSLPSREAETTIQNVIQDLSSSVKPSIRKASGAHGVPRSTIGHYLTGHLLRHKAYLGLLHPL